MSGKFNHMMVSEDPQLEKQIGCMTGILHLLDGHHIKRLYGNKRITAGRSPSVRGSPQREENVAAGSRALRSPCLQRNNKALQETPRLSIDSKKPVRRSLDFRDVIRDSFQRDSPKTPTAIPEKPLSKEASKPSNDPNDTSRIATDRRHTCKQPLNFSPEITRKSADLSESLMVLEKFRESPWNCGGNTELSRCSFESKDGENFLFMKNHPRFSCDGRETPRPCCLDRKEAFRCSSLKVRDSSRISVESKEPSRASPDSGKKHSPNLIARLMGLEELPDLSPKRMESKQSPVHQEVIGNSGFKNSTDAKKIHNSNSKTAVEGPIPGQFPDNDVSLALEKKRKLIGELEKCDKDLQALKKMVEALQLREGITCPEVNSETPVVIMKPSMLLLKSNTPSTSSYATNYSGFNGSIIDKSTGLADQNATNTTKIVDKNRFNNDIAPVIHRQKRMAKKISCEETSTAPSQPLAVAQPAHRCQSLTSNESLPKLKSSSIIASKQRSKVGFGNKDENSRFLASNTQENFPNGSNLNLQCTSPSQVKRILDFRQESESVTAEEECKSIKAESKHTGKRSDSEGEIILDRALENASEIPEQPSPVSVLDNSFYKEYHFPSPVTKCPINFQEDEIKRPDDHLGDIKADRNRLSCIAPSIKANVAQIPDNSIISTESILEPPEINNKLLEFHYVNQIFTASGLLKDDEAEDLSSTQFHSMGLSIDSEIFHELEQKHKIITGEKDYAIKQLNRRLLFDTVNDILASKFHLQEFINSDPKFVCKRLTGRGLLKQVCDELGRLQCVHSLDIGENLGRILQKDLLHDMGAWSDSTKETNEVVTGVERMIFRELIHEIIRDLVFCGRSKSACTARRQLTFS